MEYISGWKSRKLHPQLRRDKNIVVPVKRKACNILASMLWCLKGLNLRNEFDTHISMCWLIRLKKPTIQQKRKTTIISRNKKVQKFKGQQMLLLCPANSQGRRKTCNNKVHKQKLKPGHLLSLHSISEVKWVEGLLLTRHKKLIIFLLR